jgi:MOSC domain-containing protein YiiM
MGFGRGMTVSGIVAAVAIQARHGLLKQPQPAITLLPGLGVQGDAHCGALVKHRYLAARDRSAPNRRQIHLIEAELHDTLRDAGFTAEPGTLGENILTRGLDLAALPAGTRLNLGTDANIEMTGLRDPCRLLNRQQPGLMAAVSLRGGDGTVFFRAAAMAIVLTGGVVRPGDPIDIVLPPRPYVALGLV